MAKGEATFLLKIKTLGQKALSRFRIDLSSIITIAKGVVNGIKQVIQTLGNLALQADKAREVETAFQALAASQGESADKMLSKMRELSKGTVSDLELMKQANNALLLGLPVDRFGDMLQIARSASKATGQSMEFMLQSIVTGLGRGSKLILDNLGILVNVTKANEDYAKSLGRTAASLSDAEKKQAFINAALAAGKKNADAMGDSGESLTDSWAKLQAQAANLAIQVGKTLTPAFQKLVQWGNQALTVMNKVFLPAGIDGLREKLARLEADQARLLELNKKGGMVAKFINAANLENINKEIAATKEKIALQAQDDTAAAARLAKTKAALAEAQAIEAQALADEKEREELAAFDKAERQKVWNDLMKEQEAQHLFEMLDMQILHEQDAEKKQALFNKRKLAKEIAINEAIKKNKMATQKFEDVINSNKVRATQGTLGTIAGLQQSSDKRLQALGKAAAIANITINTARGVMEAWKLGPIIGPILAPLVVAAGAVQMAKVTSAPALAEGGIVQATPGGTPVIVGEGGSDEAVLPLDGSAGGIGNTINITVNGGLLGDEAQAREFAIAIDRELLGLRQDNESVSFDSDFV